MYVLEVRSIYPILEEPQLYFQMVSSNQGEEIPWKEK